MNKVVFPALLVATIMVAGAFAFVPVEQASTVHASGVLTSTAFAAGAVDSAAIATDTIVAADIATDAIGALELADNSVALANMLDSSVGTTEIVDDTIAAADIATDAVGASELADNSVALANMLDSSVGTTEIVDDTIKTEDVVGSDSQDSPFRVVVTTSAGALATTSTSYTPAVATNAIVTCSVLITENNSAAITDGTLTISITSGGGAISGDAGVLIPDIIQTKSDQFSRTWHITGTAATAQQYACTVGGTVVAAEVISNDLVVIFFPQ